MARSSFCRHVQRGNIAAGALVAGLFFGVIAIFGLLVIPGSIMNSTAIRIDPLHARTTVGEEFTVKVTLDSMIPVNAFEGRLRFSEKTLEVVSLSFEDSVADLWVREPSFDNNAGTITFIGGTTRAGGFSGSDTIVTVTFRGKETGEAAVLIEKSVVLRHDGKGTDAPLEAPVDASYIVERLEKGAPNVVTQTPAPTSYTVSPTPPPSPDINGDGVYSFADISALIRHLRSADTRYDLNQDGSVTAGDINVIIEKIRE